MLYPNKSFIRIIGIQKIDASNNVRGEVKEVRAATDTSRMSILYKEPISMLQKQISTLLQKIYALDPRLLSLCNIHDLTSSTPSVFQDFYTIM